MNIDKVIEDGINITPGVHRRSIIRI